MVAYAVLAERLTPEAEALLLEMAELHLAASTTPRRCFIATRTINGKTSLTFRSADVGDHYGADEVALNDLVGYSLLRSQQLGAGSTLYEVSGETLAFIRWLREQRGGPLAELEREVRKLADGETFAAGHPGAAHHLREALALLYGDQPTRPAISSELGNHLRSALIDKPATSISTQAI